MEVRTIARAIRRRLFPPQRFALHPQWRRVEERMAKADRILDLGCGSTPHPRAGFAVDRYVEPEQRLHGEGSRIRADVFEASGTKLAVATLERLPFADAAFDFAYSHHVFEHLEHPERACAEMARVARAGVVITPSVFAEHAFGRPYHLWMVASIGSSLVFLRKLPEVDRPFGEHPRKGADGRFVIDERSNPFDLLLNTPGWYRGRERMPRLSKRLRELWFGHHPVVEVVHHWEGALDCVVIDENGVR